MARRARISGGLNFCFAAVCLTAASAQTTQTPQASKQTPKETVTVKASRPSVQVLPDRTVYSLDKNIQSATSTLSDVLRNIPSVNVDIEGNLSMRGDSNVTVLIDGKKSPLLAGNLADALQQIPADMVERIEVITNPSAEFRAEGSGGIINIILRKDREMPASGIVRVNVGNAGRLNASASGKVRFGRVNLNGAYGERRDTHASASSGSRSNGTTLEFSQDTAASSKYSGRYVWLAADTDIPGNNHVELGGSYNRFGGHFASHQHYVAPPSGSDVLRDSLGHWQREGYGTQFSYSHKFDRKDEEFTLEVSRYTSWGLNTNDYTNFETASGLADYWQSRKSIFRETHTELKADYVRPLPDKGKFKLGYQLQNDTNLSDNNGLWRDPTMTDWSPDTTFINYFVLDRTIHAAYVSYEQHFGRFGVMAGLRAEQDFLSTNLKTTGEVHNTSTLGFYPSADVNYSLTDTQQLRLSYSRRMNRPGTYALNPARYSSDAFNVWAGNPYLKPEQVDSFEASYHDIGESFDAVVTGYYRATYKGITNVYRNLSPTVLLTTMDNLARRMAAGVETNLNVTPLSGLTLRTSGSLAYSEFNPGAQGVGVKQSGLNWNIKGGIDWQATPDDLFQFNANYTGKEHFAQGYNEPRLFGDFGYKHSFGDGLASAVSVGNLFQSWGGTVLDSPGLHQVSRHAWLGRTYYVGLVYTFGGAKDTEPASGGGSGNMATSPGGGPPQ